MAVSLEKPTLGDVLTDAFRPGDTIALRDESYGLVRHELVSSVVEGAGLPGAMIVTAGDHGPQAYRVDKFSQYDAAHCEIAIRVPGAGRVWLVNETRYMARLRAAVTIA